MKKNLSSLNFSFSLNNNYNNHRQYETTYKSAYGNFYKSKYNFVIGTNSNVSNSQCIYLDQTNNNIPNSQLICPNCINKSLVKIKSRPKIKRFSKNNNYFEDKMRSIYEIKRKNEIKNREERAKMTYSSLFKNRGRSKEMYNNLNFDEHKVNGQEEEYFGKDIDYGMKRCRNRELNNDIKLFGIDLNKKLKKNKSCIGNNYLLDKMEYSEIINRQIENNNRKTENDKNEKIKEENRLLNEQLKHEKNRIKQERENKNNIKIEMNRVNSALLREKKIKEYKEKSQKRKDKECITKLCKKEIEEFIQNLRKKKLKNKNIDEDNYKTTLIKNRQNMKQKLKNNKSFLGLSLKGIENKKCEQCRREYPKNVLSQIYYSYNIQQKK